MPSIGHFKIYAPVEPCTYSGDELKEVIDKILKDRFPEGSREVDLQGCCIGPNGFQLVLENERLAQVKRLNIGGNKIKDEGAVLLAASPFVSKLNLLDLSANEIGPEGVEAICKSPHLSKLKKLVLYRNSIANEGAKALASQNRLELIEELDLAWTEIGDPGLLSLAESKRFPNLVALYMDNNFATRNAKEQAKLSPVFRKLSSLNL